MIDGKLFDQAIINTARERTYKQLREALVYSDLELAQVYGEYLKLVDENKMADHKLEIDFETADRITVTNLQSYRKQLKKELKDYEKGSWLHPEDVAINLNVIQAIDIVLRQYGVK